MQSLRGFEGISPSLLPSSPETCLRSLDARAGAKSRLFQHANGMDSGSDKGQRMEALREAFVSPRLRPL